MNADLVGLKKVVKNIIPSPPALTGGRGNWLKAEPEGFSEPSFNERVMKVTPQISSSLG